MTGFTVHNNELKEHHVAALRLSQYLTSGHFLQATFENWESEFLQMALYILLTVKLYQIGSAESKDPDEQVDDNELHPNEGSPWPVKKGGFLLSLYSHTLSVALLFLFFFSFVMHLYGSLISYNEEQTLKHLPTEVWTSYIFSAQFWFESFQNWQSEFLAVASIVILSIWLREKGSPESKPVNAPHSQTGD